MLGYLTGFDDIYDQFERLNREMEGLLGGRPARTGIRSLESGSFPAINVGASEEQVDVYAFVPGVEPGSLDIQLQQNLLTIAGERRGDLPEDVQGYRNERFSGAFRRVLTLPEDVDPDKVNASYKDGVLHVTVARAEASRPRKIEVH